MNIDPKKPITLSIPHQVVITQEDINTGVRGSTEYCPLAIALRRAIPNHSIEVTADGLRIGDLPPMPFPCSLAESINRFDQGEPLEPFSIFFCGGDSLPPLETGRLYSPTRVLQEMRLPVISAPARPLLV
jgi:hypothetical protein